MHVSKNRVDFAHLEGGTFRRHSSGAKWPWWGIGKEEVPML